MTRLEEFKANAEAKRIERAALEEQALAEGKLWTVQIAYHKSIAFASIWKGRNTEAQQRFFTNVEHSAAPMFLDPTIILGDLLHVRQQCCKMASVAEMYIRVEGGI